MIFNKYTVGAACVAMGLTWYASVIIASKFVK